MGRLPHIDDRQPTKGRPDGVEKDRPILGIWDSEPRKPTHQNRHQAETMSRTLQLFWADYPADSDKDVLVFAGRLWIRDRDAVLIHPGDAGLTNTNIDRDHVALMLEQCLRVLNAKAPLYAYENGELVDCVEPDEA